MDNRKGYLLADLVIHDRSMLANQYKSKVQAVLEEFNARILAVANNPIAIEGDRKLDQIVLLEFDSAADARRFYDSPQYQEILDFRLRSSTSNLFIIEGSLPDSQIS